MEKVRVRTIEIVDNKKVAKAFLVTGFEFTLKDFEDLTFIAYIEKDRYYHWRIWKIAELTTGVCLSTCGCLTYQEAIDNVYQTLKLNLKLDSFKLKKKLAKELELYGLVKNLEIS
jgi:hypothetical protein